MIKIAQVDDDKNFNFLFYSLVEEYNKYHPKEPIVLTSFSSGEKFWKNFEKGPEDYDLVILDISIGQENGYDVAKSIYDSSTHEVLPVVLMLSSHIPPDETFASLLHKSHIDLEEILNRFKTLALDAEHRNMTDVLLRSEEYSFNLAHA
jgi:DNA-binding response OmpR family regulator